MIHSFTFTSDYASGSFDDLYQLAIGMAADWFDICPVHDADALTVNINHHISEVKDEFNTLTDITVAYDDEYFDEDEDSEDDSVATEPATTETATDDIPPLISFIISPSLFGFPTMEDFMKGASGK